MIGHPLHPPTVHFPLGLLASTTVWDVVALSSGKPVFWAIAFHVTWLGLVAAVPAVTTGLLELRRFREASDLTGMALRHAGFMATAISCYAISLVLRAGTEPPIGIERVLAVVLGAAGLVSLIAGGFQGGELVYTRNVGTVAEPREERRSRHEEPRGYPKEHHT